MITSFFVLLVCQKPRKIYFFVPLIPTLCVPTVCKETLEWADTVSPSAKVGERVVLQVGAAAENRLQPGARLARPLGQGRKRHVSHDVHLARLQLFT